MAQFNITSVMADKRSKKRLPHDGQKPSWDSPLPLGQIQAIEVLDVLLTIVNGEIDVVRSVRGNGIGRVDLVVNLIGDISDSSTGLFIEGSVTTNG